MRKLLLIILLLISHFGYAQNDNKIITSIIARQESDWNRNDMSSYAMAFSDDAVLINFLGLFWKGRKEIVEQFRLINECCIKPTRVKFEIKDIRILNQNTAVAYISETLTAVQNYNVPGKIVMKGTIEHKIITAVFLKDKAEWKITSMQVTQIVPLPPK
ncbi:SgcJ/EcaC family oxidoreductase [Pedobacter aquatilis]|uniref:SgcJ/EcaC family oxidoreductase n=1 Tax=Pedobacter aquatilis TaxID=351343 RepID=UPI0029314146|nr:SgcJ/EcaC family oxidoreductase [Pedobacter aquatilis]